MILQRNIRIASCYSRIRFFVNPVTFVRNNLVGIVKPLRKHFGTLRKCVVIKLIWEFLSPKEMSYRTILHTSSNIQHNNLHVRSHKHMKSFISQLDKLRWVGSYCGYYHTMCAYTSRHRKFMFEERFFKGEFFAASMLRVYWKTKDCEDFLKISRNSRLKELRYGFWWVVKSTLESWWTFIDVGSQNTLEWIENGRKIQDQFLNH